MTRDFDLSYHFLVSKRDDVKTSSASTTQRRELIKYAELAYEAFANEVAVSTVRRGLPVTSPPCWEELTADRKEAWIVAAIAVLAAASRDGKLR